MLIWWTCALVTINHIQELYPDKVLVSPAPAGGRTDWFDPFFEVSWAHSAPILTNKYSSLSRPANNWAAGLTTWQPMTMMVMWTMSWKNLRSSTIGGSQFEEITDLVNLQDLVANIFCCHSICDAMCAVLFLLHRSCRSDFEKLLCWGECKSSVGAHLYNIRTKIYAKSFNFDPDMGEKFGWLSLPCAAHMMWKKWRILSGYCWNLLIKENHKIKEHILRKTSGHHSAARRGWLCLPLLLVHHKASARSTRNQSFPVFRYSHDGGNGGNWFLDGSVNTLFVPDSDQLSSVGQLYNEL